MFCRYDPRKRDASCSRRLVFGIVDRFHFFHLALGVIRDDDLERIQHSHDAGRSLIQIFAQAMLELFDFVQAIGKNKIKIRTYERGVETETLACGTGAVASAIMAAVRLDLTPPITVQVQSGEELLVHIKISDEAITDVFLQGSAYILFDGSLMYDDVSCKISPVEPSPRAAQSVPDK